MRNRTWNNSRVRIEKRGSECIVTTYKEDGTEATTIRYAGSDYDWLVSYYEKNS